MKLINLLPPGKYPWFIELIDSQQLEVFLISENTEETDYGFFYSAARGLHSHELYTAAPRRITKLWDFAKLDGVSDPGIQIVIRCKVSKLILGYLCSKPSDGEQAELGWLASIRGILNHLCFPTKFGTNIGALLLTSYSLFLLEKTNIKILQLSALDEAVEFYKKVGMDFIGKEDEDESIFSTNKLPIPNKEYYGKTSYSPMDSSAIVFQRILRGHKIFKMCAEINEVIQYIESKKAGLAKQDYQALCNIQDCFYNTSVIIRNSTYNPIQSQAEFSAVFAVTQKYLRMPFIQKYKHNPLVREILIQFNCNEV